MSPSKATLKILAEQGVTARDVYQIGKARKIVDEVNARLVAAGAPVGFCVVIVNTTPVRAQWGNGPVEFDESGSAVTAGQAAERPED